MTTATEKKVNAIEDSVKGEQVAKAPKPTEATADKGKGVSADQSKSVKVKPFSETTVADLANQLKKGTLGDLNGFNGAAAKDKAMKKISKTLDEAVDSIKLKFKPWEVGGVHYYTKEELAQLKTPWVMLNGALVEPTQENIPEAGRISTSNGHTFWLNVRPPVSAKESSRTFTYYAVELDGVKLHLLLDDKSSCQLGAGANYHRGPNYPDTTRSGINSVVLVNTDSVHDIFYGEVMLQDQSTRSCHFNSSTVSSQQRNYDQSRGFALWNPPSARRQELRYCTLYRSSIFNSHITDSINLRDCTVDDCTIKASDGFLADNSRLQRTTIKASRARLKFAILIDTRIPSNGPVLIVNTTMKDENLSEKALYIPNKFCTLKIDLPHEHLNMRRETTTKFGISLGYRQPAELPLTATMDEIDTKVREVLRDSSYHNPLDPDLKDPVVNNLIHYVVQSIRSRLRVITMLDSAVNTARVVTGESYRENYDDEFGDYARPF